MGYLTQGRAFLTHTTLITLMEELEDVQTDLRILVSQEGTKFEDFRARAGALRGFYNSLLGDPLSGSTVPAIYRGWEVLNALDVSERGTSLLLRGQRSCIMLTNYLAWYWLDVHIRDACNSIMDKPTDCPIECPWLVQLVQDVQDAYYLQIRQHQFSSSSYGIIIPSGHTTTFQFINERRNALEGNALRAQVLTTVENIL